MSFFILEICSSKGAYEAKPEMKMKIDMDRSEKIFRENGYEIICNARVLLIVKKECEITVYPDGRLLLKTDSNEEARESADGIYRVLGNEAPFH